MTHRTMAVVAVLAACMLQPAVGWAQREGYAVSVGVLTVSSSVGDALSSPDFQVRIRRRDPAIQARISTLDDRLRRLDGEADQLLDRIEPLRRARYIRGVVQGEQPSRERRLQPLLRVLRTPWRSVRSGVRAVEGRGATTSRSSHGRLTTNGDPRCPAIRARSRSCGNGRSTEKGNHYARTKIFGRCRCRHLEISGNRECRLGAGAISHDSRAARRDQSNGVGCLV